MHHSRLPIARAAFFAATLTGIQLATAVGAFASGPLPPSGPHPNWGIQAGLYGKTKLPSGHFTYALRPGSHLSDALNLFNFAPQTQRLAVYAADLRTLRGGGFAPAQAYETMHGVGSWISLRHTQVSVPPTHTLRDPFTVHVPRGTAPGDYYGALVAASDAGRARNGMHISSRVALVVHLTVPGAVHLQVALGTLSASQRGSRELFALKVWSRSNVTFNLNGTVNIRSGGSVHRLALAPLDVYVVPGGWTTLHAVWRGTPTFDRPTAQAVVQVRINGRLYRTYRSGTLDLTFFPWIQSGMGLVLLISMLGIGVYTRPWWAAEIRRRREERTVLKEYRRSRTTASATRRSE